MGFGKDRWLIGLWCSSSDSHQTWPHRFILTVNSGRSRLPSSQDGQVQKACRSRHRKRKHQSFLPLWSTCRLQYTYVSSIQPWWHPDVILDSVVTVTVCLLHGHKVAIWIPPVMFLSRSWRFVWNLIQNHWIEWTVIVHLSAFPVSTGRHCLIYLTAFAWDVPRWCLKIQAMHFWNFEKMRGIFGIFPILWERIGNQRIFWFGAENTCPISDNYFNILGHFW